MAFSVGEADRPISLRLSHAPRKIAHGGSGKAVVLEFQSLFRFRRLAAAFSRAWPPRLYGRYYHMTQ